MSNKLSIRFYSDALLHVEHLVRETRGEPVGRVSFSFFNGDRIVFYGQSPPNDQRTVPINLSPFRCGKIFCMTWISIEVTCAERVRSIWSVKQPAVQIVDANQKVNSAPIHLFVDRHRRLCTHLWLPSQNAAHVWADDVAFSTRCFVRAHDDDRRDRRTRAIDNSCQFLPLRNCADKNAN